MQNPNTSAHDPQTLEAVAELLLWLGFDRVADHIYADLEAHAEPSQCTCPGDWDEVFAS